MSVSLSACVCALRTVPNICTLHVEPSEAWEQRIKWTQIRLTVIKVLWFLFFFICICFANQSVRYICMYIRALYMFYCAPLDLRCIYVLTRDCSSSQWAGRQIHTYSLRLCCFVIIASRIPAKNSMFWFWKLFNSLRKFFSWALLWLLYTASYKTARYQISPAGLHVSLSTRLFSGHCLVAPDAESWHCLSSPDWLPRDNKCITIVDFLLLMFLCSIFR